MNEWKPILHLARASLWLLGAVVLFCVATVVGLGYLERSLKGNLLELQNAAQEQKNLLASKQEDLSNMREHIKSYESLRKHGLIGTPDRTLWVEQLQASYRHLGFDGRITYQLQAPKPLGQELAMPGAAQSDPTLPLSHDLQFEMRDSHELDVLNLIEDFRMQVKGRFRVNSCALQDPKELGISAKCLLRFWTLPI